MDEQQQKQSQWTAKEASRARFHRLRPDHCSCVNIRNNPTSDRPAKNSADTHPYCSVGRKRAEGVSCTIVPLFHSDGVQQGRQFVDL